MATRWESFPIKFEGGLTTNLGRIEQGVQAPGSATILQNFEADVQGGYTRIQGYDKFSATAVGGTGQIIGVVASGASEALAIRGGILQYSTGTTWTNKLTLVSALPTSIAYDTFNFNGVRKLVIVDGFNKPYIFNTVTKAAAFLVTSPANANGAIDVSVFKNHIFYSKESVLTFSSPFLEDDFTPANGAGDINVGDKITGTIVFRDQLIIFCLNSIYRLSGNTQADFVLSPITKNTGCLSRDTIQEVGGDILYLGPDGIRYLSATERLGDFGLARASEKIQKNVMFGLNPSSKLATVTISNKNQYRFFSFVSNVVQADAEGFIGVKFLDQTSENISWSTTKGIKVYSVSKYQETDREYIIFSSDTGFVYRMEVGSSFDGSVIPAIFETPYMPVTDPRKRKTLYKHTLYVKPMGDLEVSLKVKYDYDGTNSSKTNPINILSGGAGSGTYGTSVYSVSTYGGLSEAEYYDNINGSGFTVALRYSSTTIKPPYNLNFVLLEYRENERR